MDVVDVQHKGQLPAHLPVFSGIREVTLTILPDIELCSPLVQVRQKRIQVELMARQATSHGYHCQAGSSWRAIKPVSHACHIHITSKMLQGKVRNTQDTAHRIWNIQRSSSPHIQQPGALCPVQQLQIDARHAFIRSKFRHRDGTRWRCISLVSCNAVTAEEGEKSDRASH